MNKINRGIIAGIVSGMLISEVIGELFNALNIDKHGVWITFFIYAFTIIYLATQKQKKEGEASE